ncbi:hypothetical protein JHK87_009839 [Glycine soja]|nr:hypothetical protein JHK87_009839 [Glycine soja]
MRWTLRGRWRSTGQQGRVIQFCVLMGGNPNRADKPFYAEWWLKFCLCCHTHFSQLGILSGTLGEVFYDLLGGWTAYLISTLYVEYRTRKEREELNFRNHVIQWVEILDGLLKRHWRNMGLASNYTFLLFGSVIQLIACARLHLSEALTWPSVLIEWKSVKKIQRVLSGSREKVNIGLNPLGQFAPLGGEQTIAQLPGYWVSIGHSSQCQHKQAYICGPLHLCSSPMGV